MNGWSNRATWDWWTRTQNFEPHYVMTQRWAREAKGDVEKLADVLEQTWNNKDINWVEISIALLEGIMD